MTGALNKKRVGFTLGTFSALMHLVWLIVVGLGLGWKILDWVFFMHHLSFTFSLASFHLDRAIGLLIMTFVGGYVVGWIFAALWNWFGKIEKK